MRLTDLEAKCTKSKIVMSSLVSFVCGVGMALIWGVPHWYWVMIIVGATFIAINHRNKLFLCLFFCSLAFGASIWRTDQVLQKISDEDFGKFNGQVEVVRGSEMKQKYQRVVVRPIQDDKYNDHKFVIFADHHPAFGYGEVLNVSCNLKKPENKYERFDYKKFLAKDGIFQVCTGAKIEKTGQKNISAAKKILFGTKGALEQKIALLFPEPESGYLAGLLLGGSDRLEEEVAEQFRRTGTTHTVAVSGYNITILASALMLIGILLGLWRQQAFWLSVVGIVFFVLMIGLPSSAVRAAIMGILILWAAKRGRLANSIRAIIFAAALMVWFSPLILFYDVGFQLSFLATLGIVTVYGPLAEKFNVKSDFLELKSILLVTISAQLGVLGILIYTFESFSPISLLANLAILPLIPLIMFSGFGVVLISFIFPALAKVFASAVWTALHFEIKVVELLSQISWASIEIKHISIAWLFGYYVFLLLLIRYLKSSAKPGEYDMLVKK